MFAQPEHEDPHTLYVDDRLMSPGAENYKEPPAEELVEQVQKFLDAQGKRPGMGDGPGT